MLRKLFLAIIIAVMPVMLWAFPGDCNFDNTIVVNGDVGGQTWTPNNLYVMVGHCVVYDGDVLTIEAGTYIWGTNPNSDWGPDEALPGALIISKGGQIDAQGTKFDPIIFTVDGDDPCDPYDIAYGSRQLWGGLLILGNGVINTTSGEGNIEGIDPELSYGAYGSVPGDDTESSGIMTYVSIRHGGYEIGEGNEINGVTFGAVGSGTTFDYLEVFNNYDDGYEWFGGDCHTKHLVSACNGDDLFDYDEGFRGKHQFWFAIYDSLTGDKCGEHDGGTSPEDGLPLAQPEIYNATIVGLGFGDGHDLTKNSRIWNIRDNAGAHYKNSIITEGTQKLVSFEDLADPAEDTRKRLEAGDLTLEYNIFYSFGSYDGTLASIVDQDFARDYFGNTAAWQGVSANATGPTNEIETVDPQLHSLTWSDATTDLDPRLDAGSPAVNGAMAAYVDPFFDAVNYKGAFGEYNSTLVDASHPELGTKLDGLWLRGWTYLWERAITPFICGDINYDDNVNILDIIAYIDWKFKQQRMPKPLAAADVNNDGSQNILDIITLIDFKFKGGAVPVCPDPSAK